VRKHEIVVGAVPELRLRQRLAAQQQRQQPRVCPPATQLTEPLMIAYRKWLQPPPEANRETDAWHAAATCVDDAAAMTSMETLLDLPLWPTCCGVYASLKTAQRSPLKCWLVQRVS